jgi:hypothetical protein
MREQASPRDLAIGSVALPWMAASVRWAGLAGSLVFAVSNLVMPAPPRAWWVEQLTPFGARTSTVARAP